MRNKPSFTLQPKKKNSEPAFSLQPMGTSKPSTPEPAFSLQPMGTSKQSTSSQPAFSLPPRRKNSVAKQAPPLKDDTTIDIPNSSGDPNRNFTLGDANAEGDRTLKNKFLWGMALGNLFILPTLLTIYSICSIKSNSSLADQLDKVNIIPESAFDNVGGRVALGYLVYTMITGTALGIANMLWQHPKNQVREFFADNEPEKQDVKALLESAKKGELDASWGQFAAGTAAFLLFAIPNIIYCYTFWDVSEDAIPLLPDYGLEIYKYLNKESGPISFLGNASLNQWFSFGIIQLVTSAYNYFQYVRKNYNIKEGQASWPRVILSSSITTKISVVSSLAFFLLSLSDDKRQQYATAELIPLSAFIVYGFVLNLEGTLGFNESFDRLKNWLCSMPDPIINLHNTLKKYPSHLKHFFYEIGYYLGLYKNYIHENDLNLPLPENSETTGLLTKDSSAINTRDDNQPRSKPAISDAELEQRVLKRIRNSGNEIPLDNNDLDRIIIEERDNAQTEQLLASTAADVWQHGRVRSTLETPISWSGPAGLSFVLLGYFFLINAQMNQDAWGSLGIEESDAASRMLSFVVFYPFIKLVHDAGYAKMNSIFTGIESRVSAAYHSYQVLRGHKASSDFDYSERFHPTSCKETLLFVLDIVVFSLQSTAFLVTPTTAGTVVVLLNRNGLLNPFTLEVAFWFTALFNSFGFAGFLAFGKEKLVDAVFHSDKWRHPFSESSNGKWEAIRATKSFFDSKNNMPGCTYDLNELTVPTA